MFYETGGWSFTSGLPKSLHNKLNGRQRSLPKPVYAALGSQDRYFIKFADGKAQFVGCESMQEELFHTQRQIASVAFGEEWDSYFIVYTDGWWKCGTIPPGLTAVLGKRGNRADLTCVSLGPDGEYYLSAKNGKSWWGGMSSEASNRFRGYKDRIKFMDFGASGAYLVRYT